MKHVRMLGLCFVAAFAVSALASASAMAANRPQYEKCGKAAKVEKKYTGQFANKECTEGVENGKYELEAIPFGTEVTSKTKAVTINVNGKAVKCKKGTDKGVIANEFAAEVTLTLTGCTVNGNKSEPCGTAGTITTSPLLAELFYIDEAETEIGVAMFSGEGTFAEFKCGTETIKIEGFLLGAEKNTKKGETFTFATSGGKQAVQSIWEFGSQLSATLISNESEVTVEGTDEAGPKGTGAFSS